MTLHAADAAQVQTETDLESIVREQIEAFAKSIDQTDAATKAGKALASHGISGGGKKLSVGKNHALTATLWNSEVMQAAMTDSCAKLIQFMQKSKKDTLYERLHIEWYSPTYRYLYWICLNKNETDIYMYEKSLFIRGWTPVKENVNANDHSLVWIFGGGFVDICIKYSEVRDSEIIYDVSVIAWDRFDFSTSGNGGFKNLISGLGALLFREFDWESKVTFQLTVPNECEHSYKTKTTKPTCTAKGYTTYTCEFCGCSYKADYTAKLSHKYDGETDGDCNTCGAVRFIRGDMDGDGEKTTADAIYLLRHSILAENYPVSQSADINGDGMVNSADAIYLLRHIIMPKEYPLT